MPQPRGGGGENAKLACHALSLKCLLLVSGERSPFSSTKESDPLRFARPLLSLQTAHLCWFFFLDEGGGGGGGSFSRLAAVSLHI